MIPRLLLFLELSWEALSAFPLVHDVLEEVTCSGRNVVAGENDEVASKTKEVVFELLATPPN